MGVKTLKRLVMGTANAFAIFQLRLFHRSSSYRSLMLKIARLIGYALSANPTFMEIGRPGMCPSAERPVSVIEIEKVNRPIVILPTNRGQISKSRKIQLYRRNALGDVLLLTPILRVLRRKYPQDKIVVTTLTPELLKGNPHLDGLVKAEVPLDGFDVTIRMEYEHTPDEHIVDAYARLVGIEVKDKTPELFLQQGELARANMILHANGVDLGKPICGMHIKSGWAVRDWPLHYFQTVAEELQKQNIQVVVLGQETEPDIAFGIDLRGKTTIREAAAIIFKSTILLTIDSSLMHLAYALRRPAVALFGCTDPEKRVPQWAQRMVLYSDVVCRGCHHRQRPVPAIFAPFCPWDTVRCMEELKPQLVLSKIRDLLNRLAKPKVSIVIPHHNNFPILEQCLWSIFRSGAEVEFEVIVVADGSTDDSVHRLKEWFPRVRLVYHAHNAGFSAACNTGAEEAEGEYLVFLNNDTTVTPGWLDELLVVIETDSRIGAVGPMLLYPGSELIQHCGTVVNEHGLCEHLYRLLPRTFIPATRLRFFRALTGACLLMRRREFLGLGGFDRSFRMGGEDTDLCFKLLDRGKLLAYCPRSVVYHHEGLSRGVRNEMHPDDLYNRRLLRERWGKYLKPDIADYCLLAEIEANEGFTWPWLQDVPPDLVAKYDRPVNRQVGRFPFRCEIGSGMHPHEGYLHLDVIEHAPSLDIRHDIQDPLPFPDNTVGEILANHVIEHVSWRALPNVIREMQRVLVPGGRVYIRTPNLRFIMERYLKGEMTPEHPDDEKALAELYGCITPGLWANIKLFSGQDYPSNFHMLCMDPEDLRHLFLRAGFSDVRIERFGREFSPGEIQLCAIK